MSNKPECPYCGTTEGLRVKCDGGGVEAPEYTCEADFTPADDGPCFDDLPGADGPVEIEIDRLRLAAFHTNSNEDKAAYYLAVSKWFQDRHYRRLAVETDQQQQDDFESGNAAWAASFIA